MGCLSELTKGLVHLVVNPLAKLEKKEFLVKTPTAIMGIRGTELYLLIGPDFTDVFVKTGTISAESRQAKVKKSDAGPGHNQYVETLMRQADVRAANVGGRLWVPPMHATRIFSNRILDLIRLADAQFRILSGMMNTGLPPNLNFGNNPGELLQNFSKLAPLGYTPPAPPAPPPGIGSAFPGGGGGGGVASPSK